MLWPLWVLADPPADPCCYPKHMCNSQRLMAPCVVATVLIMTSCMPAGVHERFQTLTVNCSLIKVGGQHLFFLATVLLYQSHQHLHTDIMTTQPSCCLGLSLAVAGIIAHSTGMYSLSHMRWQFWWVAILLQLICVGQHNTFRNTMLLLWPHIMHWAVALCMAFGTADLWLSNVPHNLWLMCYLFCSYSSFLFAAWHCNHTAVQDLHTAMTLTCTPASSMHAFSGCIVKFIHDCMAQTALSLTYLSQVSLLCMNPRVLRTAIS